MNCQRSLIINIHFEFLQDLPDIQELIAEVNAEKYSLQAAAILGENSFWAQIFYYIRILWLDSTLHPRRIGT